MNLITSTELRTKTPQVIDILLAGGSVDLIHRSRIVGEIRPKKSEGKVFNAKRFLKIIERLNLPHLSYAEREKKYREAMERKHGKTVRRH